VAWQNAWQVWFLFGVPIVFSMFAAGSTRSRVIGRENGAGL
jgi:hypothetical protein